VEGVRLRGIPKNKENMYRVTEIEQKHCQARKLNREDAMDRNIWKKQIKDN